MTVFVGSEIPALGESDTDPFLSLEGGATEVYLIRHAAVPLGFAGLGPKGKPCGRIPIPFKKGENGTGSELN